MGKLVSWSRVSAELEYEPRNLAIKMCTFQLVQQS